MSTIDIIDRGMECLLENLGTIETERFISLLIRERFDYTKWRQQYFGNTGVTDLNQAASAYAEEHPFHPYKTLQEIE